MSDKYKTQIDLLKQSKEDVENMIVEVENDYEGMKAAVKSGSTAKEILEGKDDTIKGHLEYLKFIVGRIQFYQDLSSDSESK